MSVSLSRPFPPFLLHTFSSFTHHCLFHSKSILWNSHSKHRYLSLRLSMATLTAASSSSSSYMCLTKVSSPPLPSTSFPISFPYHPKLPRDSSFSLASPVTSRTSVRFNPSFARDDEFGDFVEMKETSETRLYSLSPFPLLFIAALPGAGTVRSLFGPFVELVKSWNLPEWLVHWGHPGNMAVVLFAMGGYGTYLGFRIRYSDNVEEKANAKDLHPKLLGGMFFFFALGATGGITSLLTSDKPIFESPHAVTGFIGLTLLTVQTLLPSLFENNPGLRNVHGILGSGIMTLFLIHAALGLQLGLSY